MKKKTDESQNQLIPGTNIQAEIVEEIEHIEINGAIKRFIKLKIGIKGKNIERRMSFTEFKDNSWIDIHLGVVARFDNKCKKSEIFEWIKANSKDVKRKIVSEKLGYFSYDGNDYFLYQGGAIKTKKEDRLDISGELKGEMCHCKLSMREGRDNTKQLIRLFLDILKIAPSNERLGSVALMSAFRAPITFIKAVRFVIWVVGETGSRKTAYFQILMQCFGSDFKDPPANWSSTPKAIELVMQQASNITLLIDDYNDAVNKKDALATIELIVGNTGNNSRRTFKVSHTENAEVGGIQAVPIITAESIPDMINSRKERCVFVPIESDDIDNEVLTKYQIAGLEGDLANVMRLYIRYILRNHRKIAGEIEMIFANYRKEAELKLGAGFHARTPSNYADLMLGLHYFLEFCLFGKYIDEIEANQFKKIHMNNLLVLLKLQPTLHENIDVKQLVFRKFSEYLNNGQFKLINIEGNKLVNKCHIKSDIHIGWVDRKNKALYIDSKASSILRTSLPNELCNILNNGAKSFWASMRKYDLLVETDVNSQKNVVRKTINGQVNLVYVLDYSLIE